MKKFCKNLMRKLRTRQGQIILLLVIGISLGSTFYYFKKTEVLPQASIFFLDDVKLPNSGDKVLVFSPHPDDETLGAGGYIAAAVKRGAIVKIVLVTDGNKHHLEAERYKEFQVATAELGVTSGNLFYLNYHDGELSKTNQGEVSLSLKKEVDNFTPNVVIYNNPSDTHPDHADVGRLVEKILHDEGDKTLSYQYLIHSNRFPQPKKYSPDDYLLPPMKLISFDNEWQKYILTADEEKAKEAAVNCYKSQLKVPILKSTMLSLIRRNELFAISQKQ